MPGFTRSQCGDSCHFEEQGPTLKHWSVSPGMLLIFLPRVTVDWLIEHPLYGAHTKYTQQDIDHSKRHQVSSYRETGRFEFGRATVDIMVFIMEMWWSTSCVTERLRSHSGSTDEPEVPNGEMPGRCLVILILTWDQPCKKIGCQDKIQEASSRCCSTKALRIDSSPSLRRASNITSETFTVERPACLGEEIRLVESRVQTILILVFTHLANDSRSWLTVSASC